MNDTLRGRYAARMTRTPVVSVLMTVRNSGPYVKLASESILAQTFGDFEFIIIDDGSEDATGRILQRLSDERVRLIQQEHRGLVASANRGLDLARGKYVARMDADDVALPDRLERQVAFLERHPEIGVLGTAYHRIDASGRWLSVTLWPESDIEIRWVSLLASPFGQPTVMMRRGLLMERGLKYDTAFEVAEDYDLWTRLLKYTSGWNLSKPLIGYRIHMRSVTSTQRELTLRNHDVVALRTICEHLPEFSITPAEVSLLRALFGGGGGGVHAPAGLRLDLAHRYLDLFDAFTRHYGETSGMRTLRRQVALRVASRAIHARPGPALMRIGRRLFALDPILPWSSLQHLRRVLACRLQERTHRSLLRSAG